MILHTIIPQEHIYGAEKEQDYRFSDVVVGGVSMQVQDLGMGRARIVRLYSANLQDYLNPAYSPGAVIRFQPDIHQE
ncbi:YlzJ-like family protein [Gorillibacterium massiliense]|uniref:YlzJ-like family protein n=1 Tax=Gorillibacterium massiliense TaxID=1280390 RepID=UPI0004B5D758|nr:YlzJ-like family protein [Gorillibacterium massiliense]